MLFNSFDFFLFFTIVIILYYILRKKEYQNILLLIMSYYFYGSWNVSFLSLIIISTIVDFFIGKKIYIISNKKHRKILLFCSMATNLGILAVFKYYNFFISNLIELFSISNSNNLFLIKIVLPVGISFYTFQTMSYTIDIYKNKLKPSLNIFDFALFVSFFPQLVAGPIERASNFLPQVTKSRKFSKVQFQEGGWLIIWGLYKKIFIADNISHIVDYTFSNNLTFNGTVAIAGILAFSVQIYCDFSGYSNIARGLCKLMGFELMVNFKFPYFVTNPSDFWRNWHISLSTWLKDYLYIPLGGNKFGSLLTYRNLIITMVLGGLWHGAAWNYVVWGIYHGFLLSIHRLLKPYLEKISFKVSIFNDVWFSFKLLSMLILTLFGWLIFRANNLSQINIFILSIFKNFQLTELSYKFLVNIVYLSIPLFLIQYTQYKKINMYFVLNINFVYKIVLISYLLCCIMFLGDYNGGEFIYFQF